MVRHPPFTPELLGGGEAAAAVTNLDARHNNIFPASLTLCFRLCYSCITWCKDAKQRTYLPVESPTFSSYWLTTTSILQVSCSHYPRTVYVHESEQASFVFFFTLRRIKEFNDLLLVKISGATFNFCSCSQAAGRTTDGDDGWMLASLNGHKWIQQLEPRGRAAAPSL